MNLHVLSISVVNQGILTTDDAKYLTIVVYSLIW